MKTASFLKHLIVVERKESKKMSMKALPEKKTQNSSTLKYEEVKGKGEMRETAAAGRIQGRFCACVL